MVADEGRAFGDLLRRHRLAAGLTQEALAAAAGLSARGIADLERGLRRFPFQRTLVQLTASLSLTPRQRRLFFAAAQRPPLFTVRSERALQPRPLQPRSPGPFEQSFLSIYEPQSENFAPTDGPPLAIPLTPLIGRDAELAALRQRMGPLVRLLTLTGPGGAGKTRLALAFAAQNLGRFADGVWLVPLAATVDPRLLASAIAHELGAPEAAGRSVINSLQEYLHGKRLLLVLDNFEHLLEAAPLVPELVSACPDLRILVTSRAALRVSGEYEYAVPPLELPRSNQLSAVELSRVAALELFVERVRAVDPGFTVTEQNAPVIAAICRRLDGLPLAIELAAGRARVLSPEALLERLDRRLSLLTSDRRDVPARQKTLRATLMWSYQLLSESERTFFRQLAVFADGFSLNAAEAVCAEDGDGPDTRGHVLDKLQALASQNQVQADGERFRILETIREFALEQLAASGQLRQAYERHAEFFLALADEAVRHMESVDEPTWLDILERDHANLGAALRWCVENGDIARGMRLGDSLRLFWFTRGHLAEGRAYLEQLLALPAGSTDRALRATVLDDAGFLARYQGDYAAARVMIEQGLAIRRHLVDRRGTADSLSNLGYVALHQEDETAARAHYEEALQIHRELGNAQGIADIVSHLGLLATYTGHVGAARALHEQSLALWRSAGDQFGIGWALSNLGAVAVLEGNVMAAFPLLAESARVNANLHSSWGVACTLEGFALLASARRQPEDALRLAGAADSLRTHAGTPLPPLGKLGLRHQLAVSWAALEPRAAAETFAQGQRLLLDDAVEYALLAGERGSPEPVAPSERTVTGLTDREREIAQLLAQGMTNQAIASQLFVGKRTVDTHVEHIMSKLAVHSRAQIAAWLNRR
jgi:non-specific serine/threonine protein kinase